jgi:signal transduction histidine kinase
MPVKNGLKILLLEDSAGDAELLQRELRMGGLEFTARRVETQPEFLEQLDAFDPDVVISDYMLPAFDGLKALDLVRQRSPLLPFILVSGAIGEERATVALKLGATDFILKGRLTRLVSCVRGSLREAEVIAARQQMELEKEHQRQELERSNADLEAFAYVASHDLKAPLRAISHLAEWIEEDIGETARPDTIENLRLLRGRVTRLQGLLDGLLAYARVGRPNDHAEALDIIDMVHDIVSFLDPPPGFMVTFEGPMPVIHTHRVPIRKVLENLIGNALRHRDREEGHVVISMSRQNGVAEFRVADDGPGIAPRFHDKIFMIFQTLASRDEVESNGIGLAIARKMVENHGGRISVESAPPTRGATFVFTWKEALD